MADIVKATQSISKAGDFRDDTKLIMQPYANWEEYLVPAPVSIAILGELVCISSNVDFSINKNPPKDGFQLIKYPDSFRACLMQVANSGWAAFNEAHKNMDQIRLHTGNVPAYIKTSVNILVQDNDELVQTILPDQLENISTISDDCERLAEQTERKFTLTIYLIQELLEACISAKKVYGDDLENVKRKIEETNMKKEDSEKAKERAQKTLQDMNKQVEEAQNTFNKAMDSLPSGWELIGMNFVEGLTEGVLTALNIFTNIAAKVVEIKLGGPMMLAQGNTLSKSGQLLGLSRTLNSFTEPNQIKWSDVFDEKEGKAKTSFLSKQFEHIKTSVASENDSDAKSKAINICTKGTNLCSELSTIAPEGKCDDGKTKEMIGGIQKLLKETEKFDSESKALTNTPAFTPEPPQQAKESGKKRAGEMAVENARFRIEQSRAQLEKAREMQKQSLENLEKNQKELTEILVTLRNCEVKEIDFNTTIKMLVKGLDAMGRVKEQWEKMVRFFQMISNIVKTCLHRSLTDFVKQSQKASQKHLSYNTKKFMKDLIYQQAFYASNVASLVNMISGTYVEISDKHLMDRISSLGKLMALDPSKPNFESERRKLHDACEEAQEAIRDLVMKNNQTFNQKAKERMNRIEGALKPMLPPVSEEKMREMKEITESAFKEMSQEDEDQFA
ncbi:uncharacterized protein LOC125739313 [Brienomyrus brachyistius]|uniref:uncharacterized protein LOC125739313 n=1 Tax=Brienomyrus brachyistius TaxID=42636 RepID=UPI0020B3556A|nr:uncharacterized protein LOC125739313 [Brienomyrus brachyistius]XP_048865261.1 uncharacterized protein LOC125739313 [Brienomyrus brachyistius]XP_048865262.1 uncharacterized protein LOC125739313 [Brienomyrus brachyistius]